MRYLHFIVIFIFYLDGIIIANRGGRFSLRVIYMLYVFKLSAIEENGRIIPKIKLSENVGKITNPGYKLLWRLFDKDTGKAIADVITLHDEVIDESVPYELFDPEFTWKRKLVSSFTAKRLMVQLFSGGSCVYRSPALNDIKKYCSEQVDTLWDEVKRFENPHNYYVDLSQKLWDLKEKLLHEYSMK